MAEFKRYTLAQALAGGTAYGINKELSRLGPDVPSKTTIKVWFRKWRRAGLLPPLPPGCGLKGGIIKASENTTSLVKTKNKKL